MVDYTIQVASIVHTTHMYHVRGRSAVSCARERRTNKLFQTISAHLHQQIKVVRFKKSKVIPVRHDHSVASLQHDQDLVVDNNVSSVSAMLP